MRTSLRKGRIAAFTAMALAAGGGFAAIPGADAQAPPAPRFSANYKLPELTPARGRDVPGLAVNPNNPNHIVEAEGDAINLQCDYRVSFDGGQTWTGGHLRAPSTPASPPFPTPACHQNFDSGGYHHFNTGIVFGSGQNVYATFSVKRGPFSRPESGIENPPADQSVVARSTDGGRTFAPAVVAIDSPNDSAQPFRVRPQLAVDPGGGTGDQDRLYISAWECARATGGCSGGGGGRRIFVARSDDSGTTWEPPVLASRANVRAAPDVPPPNPWGTLDEQAREPSQPVIGPDGAVYVAYRNRDAAPGGTTCPANPGTNPPNQPAHCVVVAKSTNLGQTWTQTSTGIPVPPGTLTNPRLAMDPAGSPTGTLYVAYQRAVPGDPVDISLQRSTDGGANWDPPVRVNDDAAGTIQTNPFVTVGPSGRVDVIWADRRHNYPGGGAHADMYYARSTNNGTSFGTNRRVTDRTINIDTGRYNELGSTFSPSFSWYGPTSVPLPDGRVLAAWQDSREGNWDTGYQDIYLSRLDPSAPIGVRSNNTATGPGLSVVLSRLAYPGGNEAVGGSGGDPVTRPVVANQSDAAAALAGSVLARANWAPMYLSPAGGLPAHVKSDSARIKPEGAYVIGPTSALSSAVSQDLLETTRDGEGVVRVAPGPTVTSANRNAEIGRRVAELMRPLPGANPEAVIVNPDSFEAPAAAGLAAALKMPILFVDNRGGANPIPPPTSAAITSLGIKRVLIVGGTGAVNTATENSLATLLGGAPNVKRLGGADQYATSEAVLAESRLRGLPSNVVYVADGARPIDGAVVGSAVGRLGGLVLLTPGGSAATAENRLVALTVDSAVDRIVANRSAGGSDPVVTAPPASPALGYPVPPLGRLSLAGCAGQASKAQLALTNGNDNRFGTAAADLIFAGSGNDVIDARAGDDCVDLGPGTDRGQGGPGRDFLQGGLGNDRVSGSSGNDRLRGFSGNDRLEGSSGRDALAGNSGRDRLLGNSGNDSLSGLSGFDRLAGGLGNDRLSGGSSGDRLNGGSGRDRISGGSGNDRISAADGRRDRISCGSGRDRVVADEGDVVSSSCERVRRR